MRKKYVENDLKGNENCFKSAGGSHQATFSTYPRECFDVNILFLVNIFISDDLPKIQLKKTVTESLKKALLKQKEQEVNKPVASEGNHKLLH